MFPYHTHPNCNSYLEIKSSNKKKNAVGQTLVTWIWKCEVRRVCNRPKRASVGDKDANERV